MLTKTLKTMRKAYQHEGQRRYLMVDAKDSVNICSRRWGKSYIVAARVHDNVREMPGSTGAFQASSYRQAHSRTLPAMLAALEDWYGWKRDIHYVIGRRPPKWMGYKDPLVVPDDLRDVVWFWNGTIMMILSQEVTLSANSLTLHWMVADEAKGLDYERLADEVLPALGGSRRYFNDPAKYPHLFGVHYFTDMPTNKEGLWLVRLYEKYRDEKLYENIIMQQRHIWQLEQQGNVTPWYLDKLKRELNLIRSKTLYYQERPIFDNLEVVGTDYVNQCARNLSGLVFRTSILCQRVDKVEGMFYESFDKKIHTYHATDLNRLSSSYAKQKYDCLFDTDIEQGKPLAISFDYGALINWLVVAQIQGKSHKTLKSFYTKKQQRLREVIALFCDYYEAHPNKTVYYYYDSTALATGYVEKDHAAYNIVHEVLRNKGWYVRDMYLGNPMSHDKKYRIINEGFTGNEKLLPMFNADNNEELLQAMQYAELQIGSKGVRKNKSGEKSLETDTSLPLEYRTDGTDAWDTNYLGCLTMPYDDDTFVY